MLRQGFVSSGVSRPAIEGSRLPEQLDTAEPDLVILDIVMPMMDEMEALRLKRMIADRIIDLEAYPF